MTRFDFVPARPYSLGWTIERFARIPDAVDRVEAGAFRRLLPARPACALAVRQSGAPGRAILRVELSGPGADRPAARRAAMQVLERALGASSDIRGFERRFAADPLLGPAIRRFRGLRVAGAPSLWEALVQAVLSQQINMSFAAALRRDLVAAFGRRARIAGERLFDFPTPERVAAAGAKGLRGFRLSKSKRDTLLRLARGFASGALSEEELRALPDEDVVERLTRVRGVGRWTAEVALLRGMGRSDAFPRATSRSGNTWRSASSAGRRPPPKRRCARSRRAGVRTEASRSSTCTPRWRIPLRKLTTHD